MVHAHALINDKVVEILAHNAIRQGAFEVCHGKLNNLIFAFSQDKTHSRPINVVFFCICVFKEQNLSY